MDCPARHQAGVPLAARGWACCRVLLSWGIALAVKPASLMTDEELMAIARGGVIKPDCWSAPLATNLLPSKVNQQIGSGPD